MLSAGGENFDPSFPESSPLFNAVGKVEMKYRAQGTSPSWKLITAVRKPSNRSGFCYMPDILVLGRRGNEKKMTKSFKSN